MEFRDNPSAGSLSIPCGWLRRRSSQLFFRTCLKTLCFWGEKNDIVQLKYGCCIFRRKPKYSWRLADAETPLRNLIGIRRVVSKSVHSDRQIFHRCQRLHFVFFVQVTYKRNCCEKMVKRKHALSKLCGILRFGECQDYSTFLLMPCSLVDGYQRGRRKHVVGNTWLDGYQCGRSKHVVGNTWVDGYQRGRRKNVGNTCLRNVAAGAGFVWGEVTTVRDAVTDTACSRLQTLRFAYKQCHPTYRSAERYRNDTICLLTATGLTPGGSTTVHIYTQTPGGSTTVHIYTQTPGGSSTVHIYTQTVHRTHGTIKIRKLTKEYIT